MSFDFFNFTEQDVTNLEGPKFNDGEKVVFLVSEVGKKSDNVYVDTIILNGTNLNKPHKFFFRDMIMDKKRWVSLCKACFPNLNPPYQPAQMVGRKVVSTVVIREGKNDPSKKYVNFDEFHPVVEQQQQQQWMPQQPLPQQPIQQQQPMQNFNTNEPLPF